MAQTALVLEGGGTRAIYTAGVLDTFMENNITFPYVIGVSAGACNGASFIGKNYKRQHDITIKYSSDKRYMGVNNLIKNGNFLNMPWIFGELTYDISPLDYDTFENSGSKLTVVVTNAETGKPEYLSQPSFRDECTIIAASCALPLATKGIEYNGKMYFDGGVTDSIPVQKALDDGYEKAVVILTQHKEYRKQPVKGSSMLTKLTKKYPELYKALANRHAMYNAQLELIDKLEKDGKVFVIRPSVPLHSSTLSSNADQLEWIYQRGCSDSVILMDKLKEFLNS